MIGTRLACFALLAGAAMTLSGCGGGGSGVGSTPTPTPTPTPAPTPTPTASYKTLDQLSGSQTFQSAGANEPVPADASAKTYKFGAGVTLSYDAPSDSYTLYTPDGYNVTMNVANIDQSKSNTSQTAYSKTSGPTVDNVLLVRPKVNGVALSYMLLADWTHLTSGGGRIDMAVGGIPTLTSDVPKTGTASYSVVVAGGAQDIVSSAFYSLNGNSTGTLSFDFGAGTVTTSLTLSGVPTKGGATVSFGTFNGAGTLDSGGPGFSGTFSGTTVSGFSGALFGPQGVEAGYGWELRTTTLQAGGYLVGRKN